MQVNIWPIYEELTLSAPNLIFYLCLTSGYIFLL